MNWTLEIHHIDVGQGDSTLIIAKNNSTVRSCLIDGGRSNDTKQKQKKVTEESRSSLHTYITKQGIEQLDIMVATHYDEDHFTGLTKLLLLKEGETDNLNKVYKKVRIYDQGWPKQLDSSYIEYVKAINGRDKKRTINHEDAQNRKRFTNDVASEEQTIKAVNLGQLKDIGLPGVPKETTKQSGTRDVPTIPIDKAGNTLINREILWDEVEGGKPGNAPIIECIAVNGWILQKDKSNKKLLSNKVDPRNEKSLAFIIKFGEFRYYIGGDIETTQEDGNKNVQGIYKYLSDSKQNISVVKCSHHGSKYSSSSTFINKLKPKVAIMSCGIDNGYGLNNVGYSKERDEKDAKHINKLEKNYIFHAKQVEIKFENKTQSVSEPEIIQIIQLENQKLKLLKGKETNIQILWQDKDKNKIAYGSVYLNETSTIEWPSENDIFDISFSEKTKITLSKNGKLSNNNSSNDVELKNGDYIVLDKNTNLHLKKSEKNFIINIDVSNQSKYKVGRERLKEIPDKTEITITEEAKITWKPKVKQTKVTMTLDIIKSENKKLTEGRITLPEGGTCEWAPGHPNQCVLQTLKNNTHVVSYYLTNDRNYFSKIARIADGVGPYPKAYTAKAIVAGAIDDKSGKKKSDSSGDVKITVEQGSNKFTVTYTDRYGKTQLPSYEYKD